VKIIIDSCGFEVALSGIRPAPEPHPRAATEDHAVLDQAEVEYFYLPLSEYRAYLDITLDRPRSEMLADPTLAFLDKVTGPAQPLDLVVAAAMHHRLPMELHEIPVDLLPPQPDGAAEALSVVRLRRHHQLRGPEAQLMAAVRTARLPVLACHQRPGRATTLDILARYMVPGAYLTVQRLEHECSFINAV